LGKEEKGKEGQFAAQEGLRKQKNIEDQRCSIILLTIFAKLIFALG
jgi:hypothetical protein